MACWVNAPFFIAIFMAYPYRYAGSFAMKPLFLKVCFDRAQHFQEYFDL